MRCKIPTCSQRQKPLDQECPTCQTGLHATCIVDSWAKGRYERTATKLACSVCKKPLPLITILKYGAQNPTAFDFFCRNIPKSLSKPEAVIAAVENVQRADREDIDRQLKTTVPKGKTKAKAVKKQKKTTALESGTGFGGQAQDQGTIARNNSLVEKDSTRLVDKLQHEIESIVSLLDGKLSIGKLRKNHFVALALGPILAGLRDCINRQLHAHECNVFPLLLLLSKNPYIAYRSLVFQENNNDNVGQKRKQVDPPSDTIQSNWKSFLKLLVSNDTAESKEVLSNLRSSISESPFVGDDIINATKEANFASAHEKQSRTRLIETAKFSSDHSEMVDAYKSALKSLQFKSVSLVEVVAANLDSHCFLGKQNKQQEAVAPTRNITPSRLKAIHRDLKAIQTSLPLEWESSVFVRVDDEQPEYISFLIIGPNGTPYENGCFMFDCFLPESYPSTPPKVLIRTTGGGTFRFNPNLYANGKVCLSLLGTWAGPGWIPGVSSLLQVILSIQALILVPEPYFNEPGYTKSASTMNESRVYNQNVQIGTMRYAILDMLRNPPYLFRDVIKSHFKLKNQELRTWINTRRIPNKDYGLLNDIRAELKKLLFDPVQQVTSPTSDVVNLAENFNRSGAAAAASVINLC